ncbi:MAG: hypothetical protein DMF81_07820 [Acidobacteria bacterium]|nr:MAG: hypothetical protein DMF81_07820 [Acidobacteriota bacterium]
MDVPGTLNSVVIATNQPVQPDDIAANLDLPLASYPGALADIVATAGEAPPRLIEPHYPIYTDDLAPVERLVDSIIYGYATEAGR